VLIAIGTLIIHEFAEKPSLKWIENQKEKGTLVSKESSK
jgi:hypothetical protein